MVLSLSLQLMNTFNKTKAANFPMQAMPPHDFPFLSELYNVLSTCPFFPAESPVEFVAPLKDTEVSKDKPVVLECEVNKPDATATWSKNSQPISVQDGYDIRQDRTRHSLHLEKVTPDDAAEYTVTVDGQSTTANLTLKGGSSQNIVKKGK